jgi:hypothetical protein
MLSADSVQPNGPGTQGFNLYVYVANNPTTWIDPTGHQLEISEGMLVAMLALVVRAGFGVVMELAGGGTITTFPSLAMFVTAWVLICLITPGCSAALTEAVTAVVDQGSRILEGIIDWIREKLRNAARDFPATPDVALQDSKAVVREADEARTGSAGPNRALIGEGMERVLAAAAVYRAETFALPDNDRQ